TPRQTKETSPLAPPRACHRYPAIRRDSSLSTDFRRLPARRPRAFDVRLVPLWLKVAYTGFMAVLVPVYWFYYGPANFLYFSDLALFFVLAAIWLESPLLASMPAVGTLATQVLWIADFIAVSMGGELTGMTRYMFDAAYPLHLRALSL